MFELDYLSQRLTFTRSTDTTNPRLIGGYAPTFEGESIDLPVTNGEPLAAELDAFLAVVRDGGRPVVNAEDGRWAVVVADALLRAARERRTVELERRSRRGDDHRPAVDHGEPGGRIDRPEPNPCRHEPARPVRPWRGEPGTAGIVAVVGAGKMGLPLAAQFASHGWEVIAVDIDEEVVAAINDGRSHVDEEPGVAELGRDGPRGRAAAGDHGRRGSRARGRRRRADRAGDARRRVATRTTGTWMRRPTAIAPGIHAGSLVIFETTLPVGDTRGRYAPRLEAASGLRAEVDGDAGFFVAFSPERLYSGAALRNLATYPKLVGGLGPSSPRPRGGVLRQRARRRDRGDVVGRGGRVLEARRHDLPRRQHRPRQRVRELRRPHRRRRDRGHRRGQQPALQPHPPARASASAATASRSTRTSCSIEPRSCHSSARAREVNDGQVDVAIEALRSELGRARRSRRARPWPDVPTRRQGAGLLARAAPDRTACVRRALACSRTTRC